MTTIQVTFSNPELRDQFFAEKKEFNRFLADELARPNPDGDVLHGAIVNFNEAWPPARVALVLEQEKKKALKPRKTICPTAWRKGHWSALDRQAAVLSQHGRELYEAEKSLLWRQGHQWAYVRQVLEGSILFRREQESSAAKPTETMPWN